MISQERYYSIGYRLALILQCKVPSRTHCHCRYRPVMILQFIIQVRVDIKVQDTAGSQLISRFRIQSELIPQCEIQDRVDITVSGTVLD